MIIGDLLSLPYAINAVFVMVLLAFLLAFIRLVRGPSLPDRVVALDLIATQSAAMIIIYTIASNQRIFIDAAIALVLVAFLGTIAFGQYVERGARDE